MRTKTILIGLLICIIGGLASAGSAADDLLFLENKYIKIFLNAGAEETGRFAVDVAAGDPTRADDDGKPLIYGHPKPWTSYTTIRINGWNYVFGRSTKKRSGAGLSGGEIVMTPVLVDNQLVTKCQYNQVLAEQILDITRGPSTGALDTARITYRITNQGLEPVEVGIRTLLDTMLGNNDGAPFRIGETEIISDLSLNQDQYPDFWQAFDSLSQPSVIAQGTLKGDGITPSDQIIFTNWGKPAVQPWEFPLEPGRDFTRLGEDELDSAVAMYWNPRKLGPGEQFKVTIYYGLGGISFAPGNTFLGISAPAEIHYSIGTSRNYSIILYLEHRGEAKAKNIQIKLKLPSGLAMASGKPEVRLGELVPGVTKQFAWEIKPDGSFQGDTGFEIQVTGEGLESNQVKREVKIIGPPLLEVTATLPELSIINNRLVPNPLSVSFKVKNIGQSTTQGLKAQLSPGAGVKLADGERSEKFLTELGPNDETMVNWQIQPIAGFKQGDFKVTVSGDNLKQLAVPVEISIPVPAVKVGFSNPGVLRPGQVFNCDLYALNLSGAKKYTLAIKYDPKQLRLVHISRGTFLVEGEELSDWSGGELDRSTGRAQLISGTRQAPFSGGETTLARLNFMVVGSGTGQIEIEKLTMYDSEGREIPLDPSTIQYKIEEDGK